MHEYKIDDVVRVRLWDDMEAEFGLTPAGNISTPGYTFVSNMRMYCGEEAEVCRITRYDREAKGRADTPAYRLRGFGGWIFEHETLEVINELSDECLASELKPETLFALFGGESK